MHTCVYCGVRYRMSQGAPQSLGPVAPVGPVMSRATKVTIAVQVGVVAIATAVYLTRDEAPPSYVKPPSYVAPLAGGVASTRLAEPPQVHVVAPEETVPATAEFTLETVQRSGAQALWIYGYLHNTSPFTLGSTKITAVFYDKAGAEIGQGSGFTEDDVIAADARAPTVLLISDAPATYERLAFEVHAERPSYLPEEVQGLELSSEPPRRDPFLGWKYVGKVHNKSGRPAAFVKVDVYAFDEDDKLAGHAFTYASAETLADGATARFDGSLIDSGKRFKRFELKVSGRAAQ